MFRAGLIFLMCISFCARAQYGKIRVHIRPVFDGRELKKDTPYVTPHGDTVFFDLLRFYISNCSPAGATQTNAHLFDWDEPSTWSFTIEKIPAGPCTAIHFILGVDSIANTSGANEGDLDPMHGMYWAWNSGYIMAKLEGHSAVCKTLHHAFEFHIGGYMPPYNAARNVTLPLPADIEIKNNVVTEVTVNADIASWLSGSLDISKVNSIVIPGKEACAMADRHSKMFSVAK